MKSIILYCLLLTTALPAAAQEPSFTAIDRYAHRVPDSVPRTIESYTRYLIRKAPTPLLRARALFTWMALNIEYDYAALTSFSRKYDLSDSALCKITFQGRQSICAGYAALYKSMCGHAGLTCEVITGYARGAGTVANEALHGSNHAWNAVYLNKRWELMDVTWGRDSAQKTAIDEFWFMPDPVAYGMTHLPDDPKWQLLDKPISLDFFNSLPNFYDNWFDMDFYGLSATIPAIQPNGDFSFTIKNDDLYEVTGWLNLYGAAGTLEIPEVIVNRKGNLYTISGHLPADGTYQLQIFARKPVLPAKNRAATYISRCIIAFTMHF